MNINDFEPKKVLKRYVAGERDIVLVDVSPLGLPFVTWHVGPGGVLVAGDYCATLEEGIRSFSERLMNIINLP